MGMFIGLPASVGLMIISLPAATAIYFPSGDGKITPDDPARIAWTLMGYAPTSTIPPITSWPLASLNRSRMR